MTIRQLTEKTNGRIYVYLADSAAESSFIDRLEREGYTFGDGVKPSERGVEEIMAVNRDLTINFVGTVGRMAFGCAKSVSGERLVRVDYREFAAQNG